MRIAGLTALAAGALILPATLAPAASAEVEDITIYAWGNSEMPVACDYVGWRPPAKGTYTIVATQGSSTKTLVVEVTGDPQLGSGSAGLPSGSS
ncbi:hypothetical protein [Nocardia sp. NPDC003979]